MLPRRVAYISSDELIDAADALPSNIGRARLTQELINAFKLLELPGSEEDENPRLLEPRARVVAPAPATREQLTRFHDEHFVGES